MAKNYTDSFDVFIDLTFYLSLRTGSRLNLGLLPPVAINRYPWIVTNWSKLYQVFKTISNGNSVLESNLVDFDRAIQSYNLGNKNNELENKTSYKKFYSFLAAIQISTLTLTPDELILQNREVDRIAQLTVDDFRNMISFMKLSLATASEQIGLGDETAAKYYQKSVNPQRKSATIDDMVLLQGGFETIKIIEGIIFDIQRTSKKAPNLIAASNNNVATNSPVRFLDIYRSFITVPFEISLEHMAQKYMGSGKRWYELVTVNSLKPPFIDEAGQKFDLLAPAAVNNCIIQDLRKGDIPVGTSIGIGSYKYREETRVIERTIENEDGTIVLFLSGKQDLNKFITAHKAYVRIYSPGTLRPGVYVKIPLTQESPMLSSIPTPKSDQLRRLDRALLNFGVDIARDEKTNDILLDANGNFKMQYGMDNVRQAVLYALRTVKKELPFHKGYGVNTNVGASYFGTTDEALIFGDVLRNTLLRDKRFLDVKIAKLSTTGTSMSLSLLVLIAGSDQPIPLSFVS